MKYKKSVSVLLILILLIGTGCQMTNRSPKDLGTPPPDNNQQQRVNQVTFDNENKNREDNPQDIADRLVSLSLKIPEVHDATAVVVGRYAVVGIDVPNDLERSEVGTVKYAVAQALKEDPKGANAIVTADPDIVQRLREMGRDIRNGQPIQGIVEELADIVGRIVPQIPRDVERREQQPPK